MFGLLCDIPLSPSLSLSLSLSLSVPLSLVTVHQQSASPQLRALLDNEHLDTSRNNVLLLAALADGVIFLTDLMITHGCMATVG